MHIFQQKITMLGSLSCVLRIQVNISLINIIEKTNFVDFLYSFGLAIGCVTPFEIIYLFNM